MSVILILQVLLYTVVVGLLGEGSTWYLVHRNDKFKEVKEQAARTTAQLDALKVSKKADKKTTQRQIQLMDKQLTQMRASVSGLQLRGTIVTAVITLIAFSQLSTLFGGQVIARLPFEPISFLKPMAHRGLPEAADPRECGALFIYIMGNMVFRHFATIAFPKEVVKGPSIWDQAMKMAEKMVD
ncbi:integral membrane protein DUF106-domain-containing protein [Catenaria anguillulae PL171]|uniref:Integral membrane protein DUF106-domain-containing protein n=1 Tax=Catenaria anguillulae PL171 TaxID=765915 RepID=A0A1Y2HHL9_9FUNG|nr:integral membrane protein DUF106-domain-containing protein [Catenaria anguillulae PL171]